MASLLFCVCGLLLMVGNVAASDCPCSDASYCNRIAVPERKEIVGYAVRLKDFANYNWTKLTTVIIYENQLEQYGMQLVCLAHKHQTRVLFAAAISSEQLVNATGRRAVVEKAFAIAEKYYMDGANIDYEVPTILPALRDGLTAFAKEMKARFSASYPHSMVILDVSWLPNIFHQLKVLADTVDFLFIMSYDEQGVMLLPCVARANSPLKYVEAGVTGYRLLGIPENKLVLGLPWYGYLYNCTDLTSDDLCHIRKIAHILCTQDVGVEIDYYPLLKMQNHSMGGRKWSDAYVSPFFNYKDNRTGVIQQIWYDDPVSLKQKYAVAEKYGLRGVGIWHVDALDNANPSDPATIDMWDTLPSY